MTPHSPCCQVCTSKLPLLVEVGVGIINCGLHDESIPRWPRCQGKQLTYYLQLGWAALLCRALLPPPLTGCIFTVTHAPPAALQTMSARTTPRHGSAQSWAWALRTPAGKSSNAWRAGGTADALLQLCDLLAAFDLTGA